MIRIRKKIVKNKIKSIMIMKRRMDRVMGRVMGRIKAKRNS